MMNILVTAASRRVPLVQAFQAAMDDLGLPGRVIATDVNAYSPAVHMADRAYGVPLGLMGGPQAASVEFVAGAADGSGGRGTETLYMELRQGAAPVDPMEWFAGLPRTGD